MPQFNLRYQKQDDYSNCIFIASQKYEPVVYKTLAKYSKKLVDKEYDTFIPIFHNNVFEYCTIRFKNIDMKLSKNATYAVTFEITKKERKGKIYVNCYTQSVKLVKPAPKIDFGEHVNLDSDSD